MAVPVAAIFVGIGLLFLAIRALHLASRGCAPSLHYHSSEFNNFIVKNCPMLQELYIPPLLWGKSGHIQTIVYGKMGRINSPFPRGERCQRMMADGATITYDIFEPQTPHPYGGDFTLLICPGIANSSESLYICTCVHYAQLQGFRVAVLNHLGALKDVPLTAPRMFTYGSTEEFGVMVDQMRERYPSTVCIAVGFSLGGNIVTKYLGERIENQSKFLAAISCCQGYDASRAVRAGMTWEHLRRAYIFAMTQNQKSIIKHHSKMLFGPEAQKKYGEFDEKKIFSCTSIFDLDEEYSRKRAGFTSLEDYYKDASCRWVIDKIHIPMFFLNAMDDPIIPTELWHVPRKFASERDNVIFATTNHGGHLGYFEGGFVTPETITWLDRIVIQYTNAAILASAAKLGLSINT